VSEFGAGQGNSYPKKKTETQCLEILKTGVNKAPVNREVKPCALVWDSYSREPCLMSSTYCKPQWELGNWSATSLWI